MNEYAQMVFHNYVRFGDTQWKVQTFVAVHTNGWFGFSLLLLNWFFKSWRGSDMICDIYSVQNRLCNAPYQASACVYIAHLLLHMLDDL